MKKIDTVWQYNSCDASCPEFQQYLLQLLKSLLSMVVYSIVYIQHNTRKVSQKKLLSEPLCLGRQILRLAVTILAWFNRSDCSGVQWNSFTVTIFYILWKTFWSWVNYARYGTPNTQKIVCTWKVYSWRITRPYCCGSVSGDGMVLRKWSRGCFCSL